MKFTRLFAYITLILSCILCADSCVISRILSADAAKSDLTPQEIAQSIHMDGILEAPFYTPTVDGPSKRRMMVYLPADYYNSKESYPVVYLLHGARGNEISWVDQGCMTEIVDSLVRNKLLPKCIFVLPNMNQYSTEEQGLHSSFKSPLRAFFDTDGAIETSFINDIVGFVDSHYRTIPDKQHRAIAGLSIGSLQAAYITATSPDVFDYVGLFSPIFKSYITGGKYSSYYDPIKVKKNRAVQFNEEHCPKVYLMMIGTNDFYFNHAEYTHLDMNVKGYRHEFITTSGGHDWPNWIEYLKYFLSECKF